MKHLKVIAYSFLAPALLLGFCILVGRHDVSWNIFIMYGMLVLGFLVIFINNEGSIRYFLRGGWPEWISIGQIWLCVLGLIVFVSASTLVWILTARAGIVRFIFIPIALAGAYLFRYAFVRNAPEDMQLYEKGRKYEEDPDALVTVAECNDSSSAYIIKGMLETNGIDAEIFGDGLSETLGVGKHSMPIRVLVRKRDKAAAEELINE